MDEQHDQIDQSESKDLTGVRRDADVKDSEAEQVVEGLERLQIRKNQFGIQNEARAQTVAGTDQKSRRVSVFKGKKRPRRAPLRDCAVVE
jgi:hypothetical protein